MITNLLRFAPCQFSSRYPDDGRLRAGVATAEPAYSRQSTGKRPANAKKRVNSKTLDCGAIGDAVHSRWAADATIISNDARGGR